MSGSTSPVVTTVTADITDLRRAAGEASQLFAKIFGDAERVSTGLRNQATATEQTSSGFRNLGTVIGQAGFQIQDFAVQVQSGTSALTALSQQGSQLLGVFGTGGAVAGAALTVGLLALSLIDGSTATKQFEEANKAFAEGQKQVIEILETSREKVERLNREMRAMANASLLTQLTEAAAGAENFGAQIVRLQPQVERLRRDLEQASPRSRAGVAADLAEVERQLNWARMQAEQASARQAQLRQQMDAVADRGTGTEKGKELPDRPRSQGTDQEVAFVWREISKAMDGFAEAAGKSSVEFDRLMAQLDPAEAAAQRYEQRITTMTAALRDGAISQEQFDRALQLSVKALDQDLARAAGTTDDLKTLGREMSTVFTSAFDGMITGSKNFGDALKRLETGIARVIERIFITKPLESALSSFFERSIGGSVSGLFSSLFGGGGGATVVPDGAGATPVYGGLYADGGPVDSNTWNIVGERGPEIFVPSSAGTIIPNNALGSGGGGGVSIAIDARGAEQGVEARIDAVLSRRMPAIYAAVREGLMGEAGRGGNVAKAFGRRQPA